MTSQSGRLRSSAGLVVLAFLHASAATAVSVDVGLVLHQVSGFGGTGAMQSWSAAGADHDSAFVSLLVRDMGLSVLRIVVPAELEPSNDNGDAATTVYDNLNIAGALSDRLAYIRAVKAEADKISAEVTLVATVLSPPAWMKTNADTAGGSLRTDSYREFAEFCESFVRIVQDSTGVLTSILSLQNEPSVGKATASCTYTSAELSALLDTVADRFSANSVSTQLTFHDDRADAYNPASRALFTQLCSDNSAVDNVATTWVHDFGAYSPAPAAWLQLAGVVDGVGRSLWVSAAYGFEDTWNGAWALARHMVTAITYGHAEAYLYRCLGTSTTEAADALTRDGVPNSKYFVMKSFARFVRPGADNVSLNTSGNVIGSAFHHPEDSLNTVVLLNVGGDTYVTVSVNSDVAPVRYSVYATSETDNCVSLGELAASDSIMLPGETILTFVGRDTVQGVNSAPRITNTPDSVVIQEGSQTTWTARAEDDDGDAITFTFGFTEAYIQQSDDSTISIAPQQGDLSTTVQVVADDGNGGTDTLELRVMVETAVGVVRSLHVPGAQSGNPVVYDHLGRRLSAALPYHRGEWASGCYIVLRRGKATVPVLLVSP